MIGQVSAPPAGAGKALSSTLTSTVLAEAMELHTTVVLWNEGTDGEAIAAGTLTEVEGETLLIRLDKVLSSEPGIMPGAKLVAAVDSHGTRYCFEVRSPRPLSNLTRGEVLRITRPGYLTIEERRRSPRRRFCEPTAVELEWDHVTEHGRVVGDLFNVSIDGLACRVSMNAAAALCEGLAVRVHFALGTPSQKFCLPAKVISLTRAASPQHVLLGMEFGTTDGTAEQIGQLQRTLERISRRNGERSA